MLVGTMEMAAILEGPVVVPIPDITLSLPCTPNIVSPWVVRSATPTMIMKEKFGTRKERRRKKVRRTS